MLLTNNFIKVLFFLCIQFSIYYAKCPNNCNGQGVCDKYARCICNLGYTGGDCSLRICPDGIAWFDMPAEKDVAHLKAECSNMGICNRNTGACICKAGFSGASCDRLTCNQNCNNFGTCVTMNDFAKRTVNNNYETIAYTSNWDSNKISGCICDARYEGYDCSRKVCPDGDDPLTKNQVNEIQLFVCVYAGSTGTFTIGFKGYNSKSIPPDATAEIVREALLHIPILSNIKVKFSVPEAPVCGISINVVSIEFLEQFGSLPSIKGLPDSTIINGKGKILVSADGTSTFIDVSGNTLSSIKGTKEADACANRGMCSPADGLCYCFATNGDSYSSSNGYGLAGTRGDCGYIASGATVSSCPGDIPCSGHGVCDSSGTFRCQCVAGWFGGDCSLRYCPTGKSWFDYPTEKDSAHNTKVECSNMGLCDYSTGMCFCRDGFVGNACQYMTCGGGIANQCNGNGQCKSMKELALWSTSNGDATWLTYGNDPNNAVTWDSDMVYGCLCDEGYSGYDCSLRDCPSGKDPNIPMGDPLNPKKALNHLEQYDEVQYLKCQADSGSFQLSFRQANTTDIPFNIIAADLSRYLSSISTIRNIEITYEKINSTFFKIPGNAEENTTLCDRSGLTFARIKFTHTAGNLPAIIPMNAKLINSLALGSNAGLPGSGSLVVTTDGAYADMNPGRGNQLLSVAGTTENLVCNNQGLCDYNTGKCMCFKSYSSSDGSGQIGSIGDCGYRLVDGVKTEL